jgi:hypothetical protein
MAVMLAAVTACASNSQVAGTSTAAGAAVPKAIGTAQYARTDRLPRNAGLVHRYRDGQFRPDVFIYSKVDGSTTRLEAYEFIESMKFQRVWGRVDKFKIQLDQPVSLTVDSQTLQGHEIVLEVIGRAQRRDSYFAVYELPDHFVKFRITQAPSDQSVLRARDFACAWMEAYLMPK